MRGFLGVQPQAVTADMVEQLGLKSTRGALLADVVKDGPADKAGLKPGDVVVALNGRPVSDNNQLTRDVGVVPPGQKINLEVVRDGKQRGIDVTLAPRPDETDQGGRSGAQGGGDKEQGDLLGLSVEDLTPQLARRAQVEPGTRGALVVDVSPDSPGAGAQIEPGDIVVEVNRLAVATAADYKKAAKGLKKGDTALLRVKHGQGTRYVPLRIP